MMTGEMMIISVQENNETRYNQQSTLGGVYDVESRVIGLCRIEVQLLRTARYVAVDDGVKNRDAATRTRSQHTLKTNGCPSLLFGYLSVRHHRFWVICPSLAPAHDAQ